MRTIQNYPENGFVFYHIKTDNPIQNYFEMHVHDYYELYYFISGKGVFHIEGNDYPLKHGDILFMNSNESHYIELDTSVPYERCYFHFKRDFIEKIDSNGVLLNFYEVRAPGKYNLLRKNNFEDNHYLYLLNNIIETPPENEIQIITSFYSLLNEIRMAFSKSSVRTELDEDAQTNKIVNYILDNLESPITLDDICQKFFLSKSHLCKLFKNAVGDTVWNYITIKRLFMAKQLIESGMIPTEVYTKCGFTDYSVFYRRYKKYFNTAPSDIKKHI